MKSFEFTVAALIFASGLWLTWVWYTSLDPQGGQSAWCDDIKLPEVLGPDGLVTSAHETVCSGFGGNSAVYVHVHKRGESESKRTLVFRYFEVGGEDAPTIKWTDNKSVQIAAAHDSQITKQLRDLEGVGIKYAIGKVDYASP